MNVKKQKPIKPKIFTTTNITDKRQSTHKRNIKAKQNNNLNSLSSFKETNPNKVSQDLTPNNSTPSNTQASPIQIKDDTNTQTEASINTFINLLSPNIIGDSPIKNMMVRNTQGKQSLFCHITFSKPLETAFAFIDNNEIKSYNNNDLVMMKENKKFALLIARTVGM